MVSSVLGSKQEPDSVGPFQRYNLQVEVWECQGRLSGTRLRSGGRLFFYFVLGGLCGP